MKILVTAPFDSKCLSQLKSEFGDIQYCSWKEHGSAFNEDELISLIKEHIADGLITEVDEVSQKVINECPQLKFIGVCRANPVNVDVKAATSKGIPVLTTPARNAQAVAELFIGNVISFMRNIVPSVEWLEGEKWSGETLGAYIKFKGNELAGKKVGFVGFGAVGQRIANMIKHFPCEIQFYDPFVTCNEYSSVSLEELFKTSDIVSIHLPVNEKTKGLISGDLLNSMKQDAIFVNTARSAVVDTNELLNVLKTNKIRGAIIDVFDHEPPTEVDYQIIHLSNVLATPHIAGATEEVESHHSTIMLDNLEKWFKYKEPKNLFNRELYVSSN
ncbi:2-hydroxyacid dehydrogenase [Bacillus sp. Marseille-P3661]|uniref:2-hydroxyacid dehydrogenase n=1 Tax=Bacillus sp. Marseille-P3661 TaxID=1936234 RepID=UPI000C831A2C|nr:2-hydroxyacid dehydrogenase [Bacillus sp. Marseille-P3661]